MYITTAKRGSADPSFGEILMNAGISKSELRLSDIITKINGKNFGAGVRFCSLSREVHFNKIKMDNL